MTQAIRSFLLLAMLAAAPTLWAQVARGGGYVEPRLNPPAFDVEKVTMLDSEMREYAENLVAVACGDLLAKHAGPDGTLKGVPAETWARVRKLMGVGMTLSPRARTPVVANARLKEGRLPGAVGNRIAADAFASLMLARARLLIDSRTPDNVRLGAYFLELATIIDPENEDAIYHLEIYRMDGNKIDWIPMLGGAE